jgi:hypothetical protein
MAMNQVQSTGVLFPEDEIVYIAPHSTSMVNDALTSFTGAVWTNLGALAEVSRESGVESITPASQNVSFQSQISKQEEKINITLQELNMSNYNRLMGSPAQAVTVVGTSTSASTSYAAGFWSTATDKFFTFPQQSWSSTSASIPIVPTSIILSGSSTYVAGVTYRVTQNDSLNWGILLLSTGAISSTDTLTLSFDYKPKSQSILYHTEYDGSLTPFMLKFYSIYSDGRTITSYYPRVEYQSGGAIADKKGDSGEFKEMKFSLTAKLHDTYTYSGNKVYKVEVQTTA